MIYLKQSTAKTLRFGPFLDDTDGKTTEDGLSIAQADIRLSKNGGAFAQTNNSSGASFDENGWYAVPFDTTDTGTLGPLSVAIHKSGALPVWREFMVVPANVYDSLVGGTDYLQTDAQQVEGSDATDQIRDAVVDDATRIDASAMNTLSSHDPGATLGTADAGDAMNLADDAITSAKFDESTAYPLESSDTGATAVARTGADSDTLETISDEIAGLNDLSAADVNAEVDTALDDYDAPTKDEMDTAFTEIKGATWDSGTDTLEDIRNKQTDIETDTQDLQTQVGTAGAGLTDLGGMSTAMKAEVNAEADTAISDAALATAANLATVDGNVDLILEDTGTDIPASIAALNDPTAGDIADAVWDEAQADHTGAGTTGESLDNSGSAGDPWSTSLPGAYGAGTAGKIVGDNINAPINTVDGVVDAIKAVTDNLPDSGALTSLAQDSTVAKDTTVAKESTLGTPVGADLSADIAANLTAVNGQNDLSAAQVNAEVDSALADYDPPTKTEMDAGFAGLNDPTAGAIADAVWDETAADHVGAGTTGKSLDDAGTGGNADTIADAVLDELLADHTTAGSLGKAVADIESDADATLTDTSTTLPAQITALNDLSAAEVNAEVDTALNDYDPPTKAEVETATELVTTNVKDTLLNKEVTDRHDNDKPKQYTAGTGTNQETVDTTIDADGNIIETEVEA